VTVTGWPVATLVLVTVVVPPGLGLKARPVELVLQDGKLTRVGGQQAIKVAVVGPSRVNSLPLWALTYTGSVMTSIE